MKIRPLPGRAPRGNMLVFITACTIGLLAALAFFGLGYVRLIGSNNEQRTAIEAASLAAARDLSMIAVNTNTAGNGSAPYGWVSLSDYAPNNAGTIAGDSWDTPVRSINTILGTIRLDLIIADQIGDAKLKTIIKQDLVNALAAQDALKAELQNAIQPGYTAHDINGNPINVYKDAEDAYKANQIRMTGSSNYITGSLKLTLGCVNNGTSTNIPIPSCGATQAQIPAAAMQGNTYMSYVDAPYNAGAGGVSDFVFAGIGNNVKLVDPKQWTATLSGLPNNAKYLPCIVKAEADQHMNSSENANGYNVHAVACAQPANVVDPRPSPGALSFSFPDGIPAEITKPADMLTDAPHRILNDGSDQAAASFSYSSNGDFPYPNPTTPTVQDYAAWPYPSLDQNTGNIFRQGLYDWWKRAGCKLNVASAVAMMTSTSYNFTPPSPLMISWKTKSSQTDPTIYTVSVAPPNGIPNGNIHVYKVDPASNQITYQTVTIAPVPYSVAAENQLYSENIGAINPSSTAEFDVGPFVLPSDPSSQTYHFDNQFDCYIRDQVYRPNGGKHCGEPMDCPVVAMGVKPELGAGGTGCKWGVPHGLGKPPAVVKQSDFAENVFPYNSTYYYTYSTGPGSNGVRPTYQKNGMAVDIRFRRQIDPDSKTAATLGFKVGYVGEKFGPGISASPVLPPPPAATDTGTSTSTDTSTSTSTSTSTGP
ncbi:MAG: hypothetical protein JSS83_07540 [Cyanobacteria bacterium SZAS LIN-3]|nr:hypothetical protein [Cyanobacteria bacterium SZAS LIN-3]